MTNKTYWKSEYSEQVYEMPEGWMPQFEGWTPVHKETYEAYCKKMGIKN